MSTREVPADAYYGVHTLRVIKDLYISNNEISDIPEFVRDIIMVKKAAAMVDKELQTIPKGVANAIITACDEVLNNGECMGQFPIDVYQDGAGISVNANTNEVLANIDLELMGHQKDEYQYLSPNGHANKCRSTNDTCPTDSRIVIYSSLIKLVGAINQLRRDFERKAVEFQDILKMGHTQLQDAIPMTLGQEFRVFSILLKEEVKNIQHATELLLGVNLDTTAIGAGLSTSKGYSPLAVRKLARATDFPCVLAEDLIETALNCDAYVMVYGTLKHLAMKMSKICNDLHLLSSDPRADLSEINLPKLQAGSSIMLAKVNPVVPEVVNQICFKVIGNGTTVTMMAEADQLQLNVMGPVIGQVMFESVHILTNACYNLLEKYISGITASKEMCEGYVYDSIGTVTYLNPFIGHHNGGIVDKICAKTGKGIRGAVLERGLLTGAKLDGIFSVQNLVHPAYKAECYTDESKQ